MPRVTRKPKERRLRGIQAREMTFLLTGQDTRGLQPYGQPIGSPFDAPAAWEENRAELLAYWIQDPTEWTRAYFMQPRPPGPGHRPWAWWRWDAEEPRRIIGENGEPVDWLEEPWAERAREVWNGDRKGFHEGRPSSCFRYPTFSDSKWESEADYLKRLGLLMDEESKALNDHDTEGSSE